MSACVPGLASPKTNWKKSWSAACCCAAPPSVCAGAAAAATAVDDEWLLLSDESATRRSSSPITSWIASRCALYSTACKSAPEYPSVRRAIDSLDNGEYRYEMDNGAVIAVSISVDRENRTATIDFTGTSPQLDSNFNAPSSVATAAVLYVFRTLVTDDIPLNDGCLRPLRIVIPEGCMLAPRYPAAVVAGNVETSQAVTGALYLDRDRLDEKLAAHREALALGAGPTMIKRYIVLLALAGRDDEALRDIQRLKNYNSAIFPGQYAALIRMLREQGDDLKPFVKRVIEVWGRPKGQSGDASDDA